MNWLQNVSDLKVSRGFYAHSYPQLHWKFVLHSSKCFDALLSHRTSYLHTQYQIFSKWIGRGGFRRLHRSMTISWKLDPAKQIPTFFFFFAFAYWKFVCIHGSRSENLTILTPLLYILLSHYVPNNFLHDFTYSIGFSCSPQGLFTAPPLNKRVQIPRLDFTPIVDSKDLFRSLKDGSVRRSPFSLFGVNLSLVNFIFQKTCSDSYRSMVKSFNLQRSHLRQVFLPSLFIIHNRVDKTAFNELAKDRVITSTALGHAFRMLPVISNATCRAQKSSEFVWIFQCY